jgi:hypothetical protein
MKDAIDAGPYGRLEPETKVVRTVAMWPLALSVGFRLFLGDSQLAPVFLRDFDTS